MAVLETAQRIFPQQEFPGRDCQRAHEGACLQNWNPLLLSREPPQGQIVGKDVFRTRAIVHRGADGKPIVQSASCLHLGADLSHGTLVDGFAGQSRRRDMLLQWMKDDAPKLGELSDS